MSFKMVSGSRCCDSLQWRHNGHHGVSDHQPHGCILNHLFRSISKKTSKLRVTGLWAGNIPMTSEFPVQMTSNGENVSIWWRYHAPPDPVIRVRIGYHPRMKLLILSQTSTVQPLKLGDGYAISPHTTLSMWLVIYAGIIINPCWWKGSHR